MKKRNQTSSEKAAFVYTVNKFQGTLDYLEKYDSGEVVAPKGVADAGYLQKRIRVVSQVPDRE